MSSRFGSAAVPRLSGSAPAPALVDPFVSSTLSEKVALAVVFATGFCGSLLLTLGLGLQDSPDVTLYTSGISFFPSPLGTALGTIAGAEGMAVVQAALIGAVAVATVVLRVPLRCVAVALPVLIWLAPLGVDVMAATLFAWGWWRGRERWYWVAAGFHLVSLLLLVAVTRARRVAAIAVLVGILLLVSTRYAAGLSMGSEAVRLPQAMAGGLVVATLGLLPGALGGVPVLTRPFVALGVALGLGVAYAVRFDLSDGYVVWTSVPQTFRYALPVVFVCFLEAARVARAERVVVDLRPTA